MSKKKQKTRIAKEVKRHDFSHLLKTKVAAKQIEAEVDATKDSKSPLDKQVGGDLRAGLIIIGVFVLFIVALWLFLGRNGEIFRLFDKIKLF